MWMEYVADPFRIEAFITFCAPYETWFGNPINTN